MNRRNSTPKVQTLAIAAAVLAAAGTVARAINPAPSLAAPRQFADGTNVVGLLVKDIDNDGQRDIVSVEQDAPFTCTIRRKTGFTPGQPYSQQSYATETFDLPAQVDDMSGFFNTRDLVFCSGGGLVVAHNVGIGGDGKLIWNVHAPLSAGTGIYLDHVRTATWNSDNLEDLVATGRDASGGGVLAVFLNGAGGLPYAFSPAVVTQLAHPAFGLTVGDFRHKFKTDVAVCYRDDGQIGVLSNPGDGSAGAVNEVLLGVATSPEAVFALQAHDASSPGFPDLVVAGSNRSGDGTKNQTTLTLIENRSTSASASPAFGTNSTFVLGAVSGPAALLPADLALADLDADGLPEVVVANRAKDAVTIVGLHPTLSGGQVTSWGSLETYDFPCNPQPTRVAFADVDGNDADVDVVTANAGGNGVNVMTGGAPPSVPLDAPTNLVVGAGKKIGSALQNGFLTFKCTNTNSDAVVGLRIRVQSTATPDDEGSWTDVPGAIDMGQLPNTRNFVAFAGEPLSGAHAVAQLYFRAVASAPDSADGIDKDPPTSKSPTRYVGPFAVSPSAAKLVLTPTLSVQGGGGGSLVRSGDTVVERLTVRNDGGLDATNVYLVGVVPKNCVLASAVGSALTVGSAVAYGPFTVAGGATTYVEFTCTAQFGAKLGTKITAAKCLAGASTKATTKVKGAAADSNTLEFASALGVTATASPPAGDTGATPGSFVTYKFDVTNFGSTALGPTLLTDKITDDVVVFSGAFDDAGGTPIPGHVPSYSADGRTVTWGFASLAPHETRRVELYLFVKYDHAREGVISNSQYVATSGAVSSASSPPAATVAMSGAGPRHAPRLRTIQYFYTGEEYFTHPQLGYITTTTNGATIDFVVGWWNDGDADLGLAALDGIAPEGTDIVAGTFQLDGAAVAAQTNAGGAYHVELGTVAGDGGAVAHTLTFKLKVRDAGAAGAKQVGQSIVSGFPGIGAPALIGTSFAAPHLTYAQIARPAQLQVDKSVDRTAIAVGQTMTHSFRLTNLGGVAAVATALQLSIPSIESYVSAVTGGTVSVKNGTVTVNVGDIAPGAFCDCSVTVKLNAMPKDARDVVLNTAVVVGPTTKSLGADDEKAATVITYHQSTEATLCDDGNCPRLFVVQAAPLLNRYGGGPVEYEIVYGNTGGVAATGCSLTLAVPSGVAVVGGSIEGSGNGKVSSNGRLVSWKFPTLPPHSANAVRLELQPGAAFADGDSFSVNTLFAAANAPAKLGGRLLVTLRFDPSSHVADDLRRALDVAGSGYSAGNAVIDAEVAKAGADSLLVESAGVDMMILSDGAYVLPLGGGQAMAFGPDALFTVTLDGSLGGVTSVGFPKLSSNVFWVGQSPRIHLVGGLSCGGIDTVDDAIKAAANLRACGGASLVCGGGLNLFDAGGTKLIDNGTAASYGSVGLGGDASNGLQGFGDAQILGGAGAVLGAGTGGPLAQGKGLVVGVGSARTNCVKGGGCVAVGGGIVLAPASLIGHDGSSLIGQDGAGLIGASGSTLIGQDGAGLIGSSGSTLIGQDGAGLIGHDGSSVISNDGGSLIGASGSTLRTNAVGNAFTRGGGN